MLAIAEGRFDEARARARAGVDRHPLSGRAVFLLGLVDHKQRRYAAARPRFERALELDPDDHVVRHFLGYCLYNLGDLAGARAALQAHLEADPDEPDSHYALGLVELEDGRLDEAERCFTRAVALTEALAGTDPVAFARRRPDIAKAKARLADVYIARDDLEAARDALRAALEIDGRLYPAWFRLGTVCRRLGRTEEAAAALAEYEATRPSATDP